jgi:predicted amidohydrolase
VTSAPVLRVAACAYPIERLSSFADFAAKQARMVADASRRGAKLLVFPEYGSMELSSLLSADEQRTLASELAGVQRFLAPMLDVFAELSVRHGVHILSPSFPERLDALDLTRNRVRLHAPSGEAVVIEKQQMTRFESEEWGIAEGEAGHVVDSALGTIGVAICYDSEFPLLVRRQVEAGADLVLVPSCTETLAGYHRVAIGSRARALENQCFVLQAPTLGKAPWSHAIDDNHGAAAVYGPVDSSLSNDGLIAQGQLDVPGWVMADLDFAALARVRADGQVRNYRDWSRALHVNGRVERLQLR